MDTNTGYTPAFRLALLVWVISETPVMIRGIASLVTRRGGRHDRGSLVVVVFMLAGGAVLGSRLAFYIPGAAITWQRPLVFFLGIALILLGTALRLWSMLTLGRFFTPNVMVRTDQQVVERGPYRFVRHPSYSGALLIMLGLGLTLTNWASLVVILLFSLVGLMYRVWVEERVLSAELGRPYTEYMQRTRRFIPFVF
jgi:protein-S-isoprenylcysteine O-methyltransferase Ste14